MNLDDRSELWTFDSASAWTAGAPYPVKQLSRSSSARDGDRLRLLGLWRLAVDG
jgi:hypothetical protein